MLAAGIVSGLVTNDVDRGTMEHVAGRVRWFKSWPDPQAS
jgi:hypothetical protein